MNAASFHLFPNLPCELRLEIWSHAIRTAELSRVGIHNFLIVEKEQYDNYEPCFAVVPTAHDGGKMNQSAYLWDLGLWTACKESREVILNFFTRQHYIEGLGNTWDTDPWDECNFQQMLGKFLYLALELRKDRSCPPVALKGPEQRTRGNDGRFIVFPVHDGFKLDLTQVTGRLFSEGHDFRVMDWNRLLPGLSFLIPEPSIPNTPIKNIIFEFDPSWHCDFPTKFWQFQFEHTPRAIVASLLEDIYRYHWTTVIWLIDRGTYECELPEQGSKQNRPWLADDRVFYDCDEEFVVSRCRRDRQDQSAVHFIYELGRSLDVQINTHGFSGLRKTTYGTECCSLFSQFGILRPRTTRASK